MVLDMVGAAGYASIERDEIGGWEAARSSRGWWTTYPGRPTMGAQWGLPLFGLLVGVAICVGAALLGDTILGLALFAMMAVYAAVLLRFGEREQTVAVPDDVSGQRFPMLTLLATATVGFIVILVAFFGFLLQTAQGESGRQLALVALAAGIGYLLVILWFRLRH
jgi:hypothetical protein